MFPKRAGRSLAASVRQSVQRGRMIPAVVQEVYFDKVTVSLSGNGQVIRNLPIIGGPVEAGQKVSVDFSSTPPQVVAKGNAYMTQDDLETALRNFGVGLIQPGTSIQIVLFSGGSSVEQFIPTETGMGSAVDMAMDGDVIWLPDVELQMNITVPDGVTIAGISSRESIIRGTVTLGLNSCLENLAVIAAIASESEVNAVIAQGAGDDAWIKKCEIHAYNCGAGPANAISIQADTQSLYVTDSVVVADSKTGASAHAFTGLGGTCKITNSRLYSKSADHYDGTTFYEYSNIGHVSELERMCSVYEAELYKVLHFYPQGDPLTVLPHLIPDTPTTVNVYTSLGGNISHNGVSQYGDYVYFEISANTIREARTSDGNAIDVQVHSGSESVAGNFVAVTRREVYALRVTTDLAMIYKVNFETEESDLVYSFDMGVDGDPETGVGETTYNNLKLDAVKMTDGTLMLVISGTWYKYEGDNIDDDPIYTSGPIFWTKDYTNSGTWIEHVGDAIFDPETQTISASLYGSAVTIVDNQYVVVVTEPQLDSGEAALAVWSLDLSTMEITISSKYIEPSYGSFSPSPSTISASKTDMLAYIHYANDFSYSNQSNHVIYKYDPTDGTFTEHYRGATDETFFLLRGNLHSYLLVSFNSGTQWTTMDLTDKSTMLDTVDNPYGSFTNVCYSYMVNDVNEILLYKKDTGEFMLWGIDDETSNTFDTSLETYTNNVDTRIAMLNECYMLVAGTRRFLVKDA